MTWLYWIIIAALALLAWDGRRRLLRSRQDAAAAAERIRSAHEKMLAEELRRRDALHDAMQEGVLLLDADLRVQRANAALREFFSIEGDPAGRTAVELLRVPQISALLQQTVEQGRVVDCEIELARLGAASQFFLVNSAHIIGLSGRTDGVLMVFHDITSLKQIERARADFVANVSHELRTPLSIIKGYAETLSTAGAAADDVSNLAAIIERHADRLTLLVDDLLTLSGIESGQMTMDMQTVHPRQAAAAVLEELRTKAAGRQVALVNNIPPSLAVTADSARLQQVLYNLIDNAIKYGREGGTVALDAGETEREAVIRVSDDGPGIPAEARERVFERFFRLDKARSREQGGTGLGLAIVKHIVLAHGGKAWAEENPGGGARFCARLRKAAVAD